MSERRSGARLAARAFPPLRPPSRPRLTAAGFFRGVADDAVDCREPMLERLGMPHYGICREPGPPPANFLSATARPVGGPRAGVKPLRDGSGSGTPPLRRIGEPRDRARLACHEGV